MANDYEIVPEKDFDSLKNEVDKIKKNPISNSTEGKELKESIERLNDSITNLLNLFKTASDSIKSENHDNETISKKIIPLYDKVEKLTIQNEKIARGIVALAEMFEDLKAKKQNESETKKMSVFDEQQKSQNFPGNPQRDNYSLPEMRPPSGLDMPPRDDFSSFNQQNFTAQPLPTMQMPPPPSNMQSPQKRKIFGFG